MTWSENFDNKADVQACARRPQGLEAEARVDKQTRRVMGVMTTHRVTPGQPQLRHRPLRRLSRP